jgi:hypothetical protein
LSRIEPITQASRVIHKRWLTAGCSFATGLKLTLAPAFCSAAPLSLVITSERTEAASDCANAAKLEAKVERLLQRPLMTQGTEADLIRVVISFDHSNDEYQASLVFLGPKPGERNLRDRSEQCESLEDAAAVAIALLLDSEIERREREAREVQRAAATIKISDGKVEIKRRQVQTTPLYVASEAGVQGGLNSTVVPWFALDIGTSPFAGWLFESSVMAFAPTTSRFDAGEITVSLAAGALRTCRLWGNDWQWGPCGSFAMGRLRGVGRGFDESLSSNLLWTALGGSLLVRHSLGDHWEMGVHGTAWVPLREQRFTVQNLGTVWNSSAILPGIELRLGVRFR